LEEFFMSKVKPLDLTKDYPRSPREKMGGYAHLARMTDKARAKAAGSLGKYIYPCPLDQALLEFLSVSGEAFLDAARDRDDREVIAWIREKATARSPEEVGKWNRGFLERRPQNEESMRRFLATRERIALHRTDVTNWIDLLDLEEGRGA
jgi:hypothetical protein